MDYKEEYEKVLNDVSTMNEHIYTLQKKVEQYETALKRIANEEFFGHSVIRRYKEIAKEALK